MKICRINMSSKSITFEDVKPEYKLLGGRGLTSKIISEEVDPNCHPLGKGQGGEKSHIRYLILVF